MPVVNTTAGIAFQNAILAGVFGPNRAAGAPDSFRVRLWQDRPDGDSPAEADWTGYDPPLWSSDDWEAPEGGEVDSDGLVGFGVPGGGGTDAARFWALHDVDTDEVVYYGPLSQPIAGAESTNPIEIRLTVPYGARN